MLRQVIRGTRQYSGLRNGRRVPNIRGGRDRDEIPAVKSDQPSRAELGIVKRNVALVISFVGSKYHGLQFQPSQQNTVTIESVLVKALVDIGAMRPTNAEDIKKVCWSRSSRTDKGVHAARIILSLKIEVPKSWIPEDESGPKHPRTVDNIRFDKVVELLNEKLPSDIRAMSCVRVGDSFVARNVCSWREYEYVLPAAILTRKVEFPLEVDSLHPVPSAEAIAERYSAFDCTKHTEEEALAKLNEALSQFLGTQNFHNFHNLSSKEITASGGQNAFFRRSYRNKQDTTESSSDEVFEDNVAIPSQENEDLDGDEGVAEVEVATPYAGKYEPIHDHWEPVDRGITQKLRRTIYEAKGDLCRTPNGQSMIAVTVRGDGFNLK